jgi:hypothetical protein
MLLANRSLRARAGARRLSLTLNPVALAANASAAAAPNPTASSPASASNSSSNPSATPPSSLFQPGDIISNSSSVEGAAMAHAGAINSTKQPSSSSSSSSGYKLEALAHSGPRSDVWKATRLADGSVVAVKVGVTGLHQYYY